MTTTALATNHKGKGGPKTEAGRKAVALNAAKHGAMSLAPVIPGLEAVEDWEAHRAGVVGALAPEGRLEEVLAERAALLLWRLFRLTRYETDSAVRAQESVEEDLAKRRKDSILYGGNWDPTIRGEAVPDVLAQAEALGHARDLLETLADMPDRRPLSGEDAATIIGDVYSYATENVDVAALELPNVPREAWVEAGEGDEFDEVVFLWEVLPEQGKWTVGRVRQCLEAVAAMEGDPVDTLIRQAALELRLKGIRYEAEAERIAAEMDNMRRARLLPDDKTLEKVMRYEAHLGRQLTSTLHELEALQKRREGEPTPMTRLDVAVGS